jgi:hypothetical protein
MKHTLKEIVDEIGESKPYTIGKSVAVHLAETVCFLYALPIIWKRLSERSEKAGSVSLRRIEPPMQAYAGTWIGIYSAVFGSKALTDSYLPGIGVLAATNLASFLYEKVKKVKKNLNTKANEYQNQRGESK